MFCYLKHIDSRCRYHTLVTTDSFFEVRRHLWMANRLEQFAHRSI